MLPGCSDLVNNEEHTSQIMMHLIGSKTSALSWDFP